MEKSWGTRFPLAPSEIQKSLYVPQFDRNVVDVSVAGAWERLAEHIESFVVRLMPARLSMDRVLILLVLIVRAQSMDCSDY